MKFRYAKYRVKDSLTKKEIVLFRPVVPVFFVFGESRIGYQALIDSGADFNIFHAEIAEYYGVKIANGTPINFAGITGEKSLAYLHPVKIEIGGLSYLSKCALSYEIAPRGFGILGQEGFFDRFRVIWHRVAKGIDKKKGAGLKAFLDTFRKEDLKSGYLKTPFREKGGEDVNRRNNSRRDSSDGRGYLDWRSLLF